MKRIALAKQIFALQLPERDIQLSMLGDWGSKLLVIGWCAFLGAFTFLALADFALFTNAKWCGSADQHCFREWVSATSGWAATIVASLTVFLLIRQINDASRSVDIASETLNENRLSAERQQRAYVYAGQTTFQIDDRGILLARLQITNHGQTPARDCLVRRFAYLGKADDIRDFEDNTVGSAMGDLAPTQKRFSDVGISRNETRENQEQIKSGNLRFHVVVNIIYTDIYNIRRETNFRLINRHKTIDGYMVISEAIRST